jgi:hypothetical protein
MMKDREFERLVETMRDQHNPPPETPRDRMWERISARRGDREEGSDTATSSAPGSAKILRFRPTVRQWAWAAAMAAVLLLGVAIGRWSGTQVESPGPLQQTVAQIHEAETAEGGQNSITPNLLYNKAAMDLFDRADVLLTDFKVTPCADQDLQAVPDWAGGMLLQTRLLLNTELAEEPALNELLLDLELVLAQIAGLNRNNCARDAAWIRTTLDQQATIDRLRLMRPKGHQHGAI